MRSFLLCAVFCFSIATIITGGSEQGNRPAVRPIDNADINASQPPVRPGQAAQPKRLRLQGTGKIIPGEKPGDKLELKGLLYGYESPIEFSAEISLESSSPSPQSPGPDAARLRQEGREIGWIQACAFILLLSLLLLLGRMLFMRSLRPRKRRRHRGHRGKEED